MIDMPPTNGHRLGTALAVAAVLLATACNSEPDRGTGQSEARAVAGPVGVNPNPSDLSALIERAAPAVVNIAVLQASPTQQNPLLQDPYFRRYFDLPEESARPRLSAGSGVIVDGERGLILTNDHVVANAQAIEVLLPDRRRFEAERLGSDPATDIALLQVRASDLPELALGNSDATRVGDQFVAIGNPFGLGQTVTSGIVSALGRGLRQDGYESYIPTDAPINPGNSGGPLIDMSGSVIGINSALFGPGANIGIGFAVPSATARFVMTQVLEHGTVRRGQIGVTINAMMIEFFRASITNGSEKTCWYHLVVNPSSGNAMRYEVGEPSSAVLTHSHASLPPP